MSDSCSRNGCNEDALWWAIREIGGDCYNIPLCKAHKQELTDD